MPSCGRAAWNATTTAGSGALCGLKDVLPTFKSQEDWEGGENEWRGVGGPIHVRRPGTPHPTAPAFLEAARQMGLAMLDDVNGPLRAGAGYINMNIAADGRRVSAARPRSCDRRSPRSRSNLSLLLNANATKVVFEGDRAVGVEIVTGDTVRSIRATREVILAAGAIHSARLLMLSGVGDSEELRRLGIAPVANLRGVGKNLQDHVLVSGVVYKYKGKMPDRPANSNAVEAEVFLPSGLSDHPADLCLVLEQLPIATPEAAARFGAHHRRKASLIAPALVQPTSRGRVRPSRARIGAMLQSVEGNHLGTDHDLSAIVRAIEAARELGRQPACSTPSAKPRRFRGRRPPASRTSWISRGPGRPASGHPVVTARMGADADAVVDPNLRVRNVRGLRVADASVMPSITAGATNAPSIMIGGRAAQLIQKAG